MRHPLLVLAASMLLCASCVHEFPDGPDMPSPPATAEPVRLYRLTLRHDSTLDLLGEFDYASGETLSTRAEGPAEARKKHSIRYIINAYAESRGEFTRSVDTTFTFLRDVESGLDASFDINMPDGSWKFIAWTDYTDEGSVSDKYYDTSDFTEIVLANRDTHFGSNQFREAFFGSAETAISRAGVTSPDTVILGESTIRMERPMARYTFITTDLRRFIENETSSARNNVAPSEVAAAPADASGAPANAPALRDYRVRFIYTRFMPCSFNAYTGKPADSWTGVAYESEIEKLSDDEARIGFDYVFVNGDRTAATVGVEVLDRDGNLLARIPAFDVPLERSRHTIVKGEFLTTKSGGEMGINPDFDGEFNIEIK